MNVIFSKIILEDCFSYEYLEFDFNSGIHSINGINGVGKTTVYLALTQCLFNKNPKGVKIENVSNTITQRPYAITLYFSKDSNEYTIVNSRKTGKITVEVNGTSISRKTIPQNLELIREIIGDSYESFVGGTYQASDSTFDLLEESSDIARKNFINRILKFDELDELLALTKEKIKRLKVLHKDKSEQVMYLVAQKLTLKEEQKLIDTKPLTYGVETLERARQEALFVAGKAKLDKEAQEVKREAYLKYKSNLELLDNLSGTLKQCGEPSTGKVEVLKQLEVKTKALAAIEAAHKTAKSRLNEIQEPELECSRCGTKLNAEQALKLYESDKAQCEYAIDEATQAGSLITAEIKALKDDLARWETIESTRQRINILSDTVVEVEVADEVTFALASKEYEDAVNTYNEASRDYTDALQRLNAANRHNDLVAMVSKFNEEARAKNSTLEAKIKQLGEELSEIERRQDMLDTWSRILGPSGYRVHSMVRFLVVLNQTMDKYADIISGGKIKCNFFVTDEGKIAFSVVDPDKQVPFANWSKGEQARVKLACLFAVLELLEIMDSGSYNVLVLDEIFSALDDEGKEGLFDVLSYLRAEGKCIYTISHTPLVNPVVFDSTIEVVKVNGLASIT